jgi:tetratricopeptide (TPR) repeat protein
MRRFVLCAALLGAVPARGEDLPARVHASDDAEALEARRHYIEGLKHYNLGEYKEALAAFKSGYRLKPDPSFLFNLGQCYRQLGDPAAATTSYRAYRREAPNSANRAEVERLIQQMETAIAEQRAKEPPTGTQAPGGPSNLALKEARPTNPLVTASQSDAPRWHRDAVGMTLAFGGLAALGVGAGLLGAGLTDVARADDASDLNRRDTLNNRGKNLSIAGGVVAGVGAVLGLAGTIRLVKVSRRRATTLAVSPHSGGAMVVLQRSF